MIQGSLGERGALIETGDFSFLIDLDAAVVNVKDAGTLFLLDEDASVSAAETGMVLGAIDRDSLRFGCLTGDCDWAKTEVVAMVEGGMLVEER